LSGFCRRKYVSLLRDPDRFALPVAPFLRQLLKERYPQFPTGQGSAFGDVLVLPASFILQQFRDELNVLKRNMSVLNYQTMLEEEFDRLAANYFVERRAGDRAFGTVRVFFEDVQPITIDQNAVFFDDSNHRWNPISSVTLTAEELQLNEIPDTGEYYVDVPVIAQDVGDQYSADVEQVNQFAGILGAVRCLNLLAFSTANAADTNTDLLIAIQDSITNNDLVKDRAIRKLLRENFTSTRSIQVVGAGDAAMARDVIDAVVSIQEMIPFSYSQKYNLPLDGNGDVNWFDEFGNVVVSPVGGTVAAIRDLTGIDYNAMDVTLDGQVDMIVSVQPNWRVRMFQAEGVPNDPDEGDYFVTRVEEVPVEPNGVPVKVIRLDQPFRDPNLGSFDPVADAEKYSYTILGPVSTNRFHVGGKIDVYVDSSANVEESVIVSALSETSPGSGIAEVPIVEEVPADPVSGLPLFEDNKAFFFPFMGVLKIEQIAGDNAVAVERTLVAGAQYVVISAEFRRQFTTQDNDVIRIFGDDENGNPLFIGKRMRITYLSSLDLPLMQEFVDGSEIETKNADISILPPEQILLDISLKYRGDLEEDVVKDVLERFIQSKSVGGSMSVQEISVVLGVVGITDIEHPVRLTSTRDTGTGQLDTTTSEDRIELETYQAFFPVDDLSVEKIG
jgi:hypothetical protein